MKLFLPQLLLCAATITEKHGFQNLFCCIIIIYFLFYLFFLHKGVPVVRGTSKRSFSRTKSSKLFQSPFFTMPLVLRQQGQRFWKNSYLFFFRFPSDESESSLIYTPSSLSLFIYIWYTNIFLLHSLCRSGPTTTRCLPPKRLTVWW